jgi:hypothetical protein
MKRKRSTIVISKDKVISQVEVLAYRRTESSLGDASVETQNAIQMDSAESTDAALLSRMLAARDAEVRKQLVYCLVPEDAADLIVGNDLNADENEYVYKLEVPENFTKDRLMNAMNSINEYFVYATLHDWYIQHGVVSTVDVTWLQSLLRQIGGAFRAEFIRKPLQPFGPAAPMTRR